MTDAHRRRIDAVLVWKFDRLARAVSHLLRALETFPVLGVHFISLSESLDTSTPAGNMVFTVLGAEAERRGKESQMMKMEYLRSIPRNGQRCLRYRDGGPRREGQMRLRGKHYIFLSGRGCTGCSGACTGPSSNGCSFAASGQAANQRACASSAADKFRVALAFAAHRLASRTGADVVGSPVNFHAFQPEPQLRWSR